MRAIWKFENPHILYGRFFVSGTISKFQPVLMLAHLAASLMKTAASSTALVWGSTFQKILERAFGFDMLYFLSLFF